jgi:hypothetical protein
MRTTIMIAAILLVGAHGVPESKVNIGTGIAIFGLFWSLAWDLVEAFTKKS